MCECEQCVLDNSHRFGRQIIWLARILRTAGNILWKIFPKWGKTMFLDPENDYKIKKVGCHNITYK